MLDQTRLTWRPPSPLRFPSPHLDFELRAPRKSDRVHNTRPFPAGLLVPRIPHTTAASHSTLQRTHNKMNAGSNDSDVPENPTGKRRRISLACSACRTRKSRVRHLPDGEQSAFCLCGGASRHCENRDEADDPKSAMESGPNALVARNWALNASMSTLHLPRM
jgi:hypothetical protein